MQKLRGHKTRNKTEIPEQVDTRLKNTQNKPGRHHPVFKQRSKALRGFTLVEILVVMGVVLILAGIIFPAFSRARESGKRTSCLSNLSQIAKGLQLYSQDNNRRYPPLPPAPADGSFGWALSIADTLKNSAFLQCPSEEKNIDNGPTDYWINGDFQGISDVKVRTPVSVILLGEGTGSPVDYALGPNVDEPWAATDSFTTRHLGGANYAFADGHVKWLLPDKISISADPDGSNATFVIG